MPKSKVYKNYIVLCEYEEDRPSARVQVYAKSEKEALNKAKELLKRWRYSVIEVFEIED